MAPQWVKKQGVVEPKQLIGKRVEAGVLRGRTVGSRGTVLQTMITDEGARIAIRWDHDGTVDWLSSQQWYDSIVKL